MENTATATNNNHIRQIEVCELLDDRYFFIPSYQRGYRWGKKQIYDLCNDLLEYALKKKNNGSKIISLIMIILAVFLIFFIY